MKICVFGAGAVGGFFAAKLAHAGHDVSVVVRAKTAAIINANGLIVRERAGESRTQVKASDDPRTLGVQDVVLLTAKAQSLGEAAKIVAPLVGKHTLMVFSQNGVACWYRHNLAAGLRVPPMLPHFEVMDAFTAQFGADQFAGGIVRSSNEMVSPGVIQNDSQTGRNSFLFSRTDDKDDARVDTLRVALAAAGIDSPIAKGSIRAEMWRKLLMTMTTGPMAILSGLTTADMIANPELSPVANAVLADAHKLSAAYGFPIPPGDVKIPHNHHKVSLLQDFERGLPMEWGEVVLAARAFAEAAQLELPSFKAIANLATFKVLEKGLLPSPDLWGYAQPDTAKRHAS